MDRPIAVLLVEDSEDDAIIMLRELRKYGFAPRSERVDTEAALRAALGRQEWDVILADYRIPGFGGPQALEVVQGGGLDIPFLLVSGAVGEETAVAMMKAGAHDFILKHALGRLGAAVDHELRDAEGRRRRRWADAALELLAETGRILADSPDFDAVVQRAARLPVPRFADGCIVYAGGANMPAEGIAFAHGEGIDGEALAALAQRYPPTGEPTDPMYADVIRTGRSALLASVTDAEIAARARDAEQARLLRRSEAGSLLIIPAVTRGRVVGVLVLLAHRPGRYSEPDRGLAEEIGARIALIIENVRLTRAREDFLSAAIHEIKTPIAVIKMSIQLLMQVPEERRVERLGEHLGRLNRQSHRLSGLLTNVLEVSRLDTRGLSLMLRSTDMSALVRQCVEAMQAVHPRHSIIMAANDAIEAEVDPCRVEEVLTNLLDNATKYSPAGSPIEVSSRRVSGAVAISVRDHGIGIPAPRQASVFERFYRAHAGTAYDHATSLGVGLYLSREFVEAHGGRIWFESREGQGSTFSFELPIAPTPHEGGR